MIFMHHSIGLGNNISKHVIIHEMGYNTAICGYNIDPI